MQSIDTNAEQNSHTLKTTILYILITLFGCLDLLVALYFSISIINNNANKVIAKNYNDYIVTATSNVNISNSRKNVYTTTANFSNLQIDNVYEGTITFITKNNESFMYKNKTLSCKFTFIPNTADGSIKINYDLPKNIFLYESVSPSIEIRKIQ